MSGIYSTNKIKNLNQLNDVNITDISNDEVLKYNATTGLWENGTAGGGGGSGDSYFFKAVIPANQGIRRSGGFGTIGLSTSGFRAPYNTNDSDLAGNIWTCPSDGLYKVHLRLVVRSTDDNMREAQIGLLDDPTFLQSGANPNFTKLIRYEQFVLTGQSGQGPADAVLSWSWSLHDLIEIVAGQTIQIVVRIYTSNTIAPITADWSSGLARTATAGNADGYGGLGFLTIEKVA
jgi:hypothetical protein